MTDLDRLRGQPSTFDLYRALRLLECAYRDRPRLGRSKLPRDDAWRLGQAPSMQFAPSTIAGHRPQRRALPEALLVYAFGLLGPNGPMPLSFTETVVDRMRGHFRDTGIRPAPQAKGLRDTTLADFLDVFHHRLLSLFWRAHADAEPTVEADRPDEDRFALHLLALCGFRPARDADRDPLDDVRRHWVGHLSRPSRNTEGLRAILQSFFHIDVRLEPFVGRWLRMPAAERCHLGATGSPLGTRCFLGDEVWDCSQTFRVVCGPLSLERYESMLPGGQSWQRLCHLVRDYVGDELAYEIRLVLRAEEVPVARLGGPRRLGWTTWLGDEPATTDRDDLCLSPETDYRHRLQPTHES